MADLANIRFLRTQACMSFNADLVIAFRHFAPSSAHILNLANEYTAFQKPELVLAPWQQVLP